MKLANSHLGEFSEALQSAFPSIDGLDAMMLYKLGLNRSVITTKSGLQAIVYDLLVWFQARDKTTDLLVSARESNPTNLELLEFSRKLDVAPLISLKKEGLEADPNSFYTEKNSRTLERRIREISEFIDFSLWNSNSGKIEGQVCRIENTKSRKIYGTGFLVGPDTLLTNYHVIEEVIENNLDPQDLGLRFDFKILPDGLTVSSGRVFRVSSDRNWLVDYSKYSAVDSLIDPQDKIPAEDELDYALLLLESNIGEKPIGENSEPSAPKRGWVYLNNNDHNYDSEKALLIVQHPEGQPMKIVIDTHSIIGVNANKTRLRYTTNTENGSSGAPCFDINWELIALHHSGDPNYAPSYKPQFNQGIPISTIYKLLEKRQKISYLGKNQ